MENTAMQMTDPKDIERFMFAGKAIFTLVSRRTGKRFTYKIRVKSPTLAFVALRTNPDFFSYLGIITPAGGFNTTHKSYDDPEAIHAFRWFRQQLTRQRPLDQVEFWHEGRCGRCNRLLTVPDSIARGIGPECATVVCEAV
jgi:hypothetical protein